MTTSIIKAQANKDRENNAARAARRKAHMRVEDGNRVVFTGKISRKHVEQVAYPAGGMGGGIILPTDGKVEQSELKVAYEAAKAAGVAITWEDANMAVIRVRRTLPRGGADDAQDLWDSLKTYFLN